MITIDSHTFDETLLAGGWIIDAGCRGWLFGGNIIDYKLPHKGIFALDIEDFSGPREIGGIEFKTTIPKGITFKHAALSAKQGKTEAYFFGNGTGNFLKGINQQPGNTEDRPCETKSVQCITLQDIYNEIGTDIDLLKMDIEGSEYEIMMNMEPIPKQISVETHQHCHPHLHNEYWPQILEKMHKHYHLHLFNCEPRYQFLDCLFIRKDIL